MKVVSKGGFIWRSRPLYVIGADGDPEGHGDARATRRQEGGYLEMAVQKHTARNHPPTPRRGREGGKALRRTKSHGIGSREVCKAFAGERILSWAHHAEVAALPQKAAGRPDQPDALAAG